jgi:hypothetical protein
MNTQSPKAPRRGDTLGADRHSLSVAALGAVMPLIGMSVSPFVVPAGSSRVLRNGLHMTNIEDRQLVGLRHAALFLPRR